MGRMMMATVSEPEKPPQQNGHSDSRIQLEDNIDNLLVKIWEIMVQLNDYSPDPDQKWVLSRTLYVEISNFILHLKIVKFLNYFYNNRSDLANCFEEIHKLQEKIKHIEV